MATTASQDPGLDAGSSRLTHVDCDGKAVMVGVSSKPVTIRTAKAAGMVLLDDTTFALVNENKSKKGDVLAIAELAGIMGAKHTAMLIPLCHNIAIDKVEVRLELDQARQAVAVSATATATGKTGVEMEALTAATVAALTVYDMCKAASFDILITDVHLVSKTGGQRGSYSRTASTEEGPS